MMWMKWIMMNGSCCSQCVIKHLLRGQSVVLKPPLRLAVSVGGVTVILSWGPEGGQVGFRGYTGRDHGI